MKRGLVLVVLALAAAGCGPGVAAAGSGGEEERKVTVSSPRDPRLAVGDRATTSSNGTTLTVLSYQAPLRVAGARPERGSTYAGIEVKGCAGPDSERSLMHLGPNAFVLRTPDGTRLHPEGFAGDAPRVKEPSLQGMNPLPGECDRGFVTFQTPQGQRPDLVLYEEEFVDKVTIAWRVPDAR